MAESRNIEGTGVTGVYDMRRGLASCIYDMRLNKDDRDLTSDMGVPLLGIKSWIYGVKILLLGSN
jgi:hypothetical protein